MIKYVAKRLALGVITLLVLITVTFCLMKSMPGSPFSGEKVLAESVQNALNAKYNLDKPLTVQYFTYLGNALQGDLGESFKYPGTTVNEVIARGLPATAKLGGVAFVVAVVVGVSLGTAAALSKSRVLNGFVAVFSTIGVSVPSFILAMLLMLFFGVQLRLLPIVGLTSWKHFIMPATALALYPIAYISRLTKTSMSEALKQDYVKMARAKGLSWPVIIVKHVMKNAMLPVITYIGPLLASMLTGSFVVENLFSIPGIGTEFVKAITNRDYSLIMGLTIFLGAIIIVANLLVDILCAAVDPRIKLDE